jgi:hypothetical protein
MVKGPNFEARIERTQKRRAEKKAEKEEKAAGLSVPPEAILTRILQIDPGKDRVLT